MAATCPLDKGVIWPSFSPFEECESKKFDKANRDMSIAKLMSHLKYRSVSSFSDATIVCLKQFLCSAHNQIEIIEAITCVENIVRQVKHHICGNKATFPQKTHDKKKCTYFS